MPGLAKSDVAAISGWLQTDAGVAPDRAEAAGRELAASWAHVAPSLFPDPKPLVQ